MLWLSSIARYLSIPAGAGLVWLIFAWSGLVREEPRTSDAKRHFDIGQALDRDGPRRAASDIEALLVQARQIALREPLNAYPYAVYGMAEYQRGRSRLAERLMRNALKLDPRSATVRGWLLFHYLKHGRVAEAVDQGAILYLLDERGDIRDDLAALFAALVQLPEAREHVIRRLSGTPHLLAIIQTGLAGGMDRRLAIRLLNTFDPKAPVHGLHEARASALEAFIDASDYEGAYALWKSSIPSQGGQKRSGHFVYDPDFAGRTGSAPFNWSLSSDERIQAELASSGLTRPTTALRVTHFHGRGVVAAHQLILLSPGPFRLAFSAFQVAARPASADDSAYELQIRCKEDGAMLLSVPVNGSSVSGWATYTRSFLVPEACPAQTLELVSPSDEFSSGRAVLITGITIVPI